MAVKGNVQGMLIYATMCLYLGALLLSLLGKRRASEGVYVAGFAVAGISFGYRWYQVGHVPLQNLFDVFLCLGMVSYPVSLFSRRVLRVGGEGADMLIGAVVLFAAGFVFSDEPQVLPPALQSWLFAPHVAVYMLAYIFMTKAAVQALGQWFGVERPAGAQTVDYEEGAYRLICVGFPLLTLGLLLGSWWAKLAWGDYWGWDPKELWSLASWLVYAGYFHFRARYGKKRARANCLWSIVGIGVIVVTLLWVNLAKVFAGLHSYAA